MDAERARTRLEEERTQLRGILEQVTDHLQTSQGESTGELSTFDQHPGDIGTETHDRERDASLREHAEVQLGEIERALERLERGEYGRCETCGEPISDERLEAMPAARFCIAHQQEHERQARVS